MATTAAQQLKLGATTLLAIAGGVLASLVAAFVFYATDHKVWAIVGTSIVGSHMLLGATFVMAGQGAADSINLLLMSGLCYTVGILLQFFVTGKQFEVRDDAVVPTSPVGVANLARVARAPPRVATTYSSSSVLWKSTK